jgi:hypothetical protein
MVLFLEQVIFAGSVTLDSDSRLEGRNTAADPGYVFLRGGLLRKAAKANLVLDETMVYASKSARISLSGGDEGSLEWVAPTNGRFEDLALWSDFVTPEGTVCSTTPTGCYNWAGQSSLVMEGVFFMPFATADYAGGSGMNQTAASGSPTSWLRAAMAFSPWRRTKDVRSSSPLPPKRT